MGETVLIDATTISELVMEKNDPEWRYATYASPITEGVQIEVHSSSGKRGLGYVSARENLPSVLSGVQVAANTIEGTDVTCIADALDRVRSQHSINDVERVAAGFEIALLDLLSREIDQPMSALFGGIRRDRIPLIRILPLKQPDEMAKSAKELAGEGYRALKIKLDHESVPLDAARVEAVRGAVGESLLLTIDANTSYTAKDALKLWERIQRFDISIFEQPVPADDLSGLKLVRDNVSCSVEAHESVTDLVALQRIVCGQVADCVNLGIFTHGPRAVFEAAAICAAGGVRYRLGIHPGPQFVAAAAAQVAACLPDLWFPCELAEHMRMSGDSSTGLEIEGGELKVPGSVGVGVGLIGDIPAS